MKPIPEEEGKRRQKFWIIIEKNKHNNNNKKQIHYKQIKIYGKIERSYCVKRGGKISKQTTAGMLNSF